MPGKRARRHFSQLIEFETGLIIGMTTAAWSTHRVAIQVDRSECADRNFWEQWTRELFYVINPQTVLRHTARTDGVMASGAIASNSWYTLIVMRGTLTGQRCIDDILRPHVGPFLNGLPGAIFRLDNAHPHTARVAQDFLRHFQTHQWPDRSFD
ncbi:transposable element Tcb2 transposase [Trichonephila clavipes]|nr:transposable element Tcb2 transposase [Trichonephila clavipes]